MSARDLAMQELRPGQGSILGGVVVWQGDGENDPTAAELEAKTAEIQARVDTQERFEIALGDTEDVAQVARKLEDLIDHIVNGTPLSQQAKDWAADRINRRANA